MKKFAIKQIKNYVNQQNNIDILLKKNLFQEAYLKDKNFIEYCKREDLLKNSNKSSEFTHMKINNNSPDKEIKDLKEIKGFKDLNTNYNKFDGKDTKGNLNKQDNNTNANNNNTNNYHRKSPLKDVSNSISNTKANINTKNKGKYSY